MVSYQKHRDDSTPHVWSDEICSMGMANRHDAIFIGKENSPTTYYGREQYGAQIAACVDGIILDVPDNVRKFEDKGLGIELLHCSGILAHAYSLWRLDFMQHLDGEFACAVRDRKSGRLILARDPYGKKPLHYHYNGNELVFSSEIKGLLAAGIEPEIDLINLSDFLSLNCIPYPATIFKNIYQVPPGCLLIFNGRDIKIQSYWHHDIEVDHSISFEDARDALSGSIHNSIRKRLIGQDTFCFLSGGIDSSTLLSYAAERSSTPVHAVTIGFAEEEANELGEAEIMAKHVGAIHHKLIATPDSFLEMLEQLVLHHDAPFTDISAYPSYFAAKLGHEFTDIIITGDGPDQLFCGSDHYVFAEKNQSLASKNIFLQRMFSFVAYCMKRFANDPTPSVTSRIYRRLYRESLSPVHAMYDLRSYFPNIVKKYLCSDELWQIHVKDDPYRHPESWFERVRNVDTINQYLYADLKFYLPDDLMIKVDRMCMAHGLETLSPFLDREISAIANRLPGNFKLHKNQDGTLSTKHILREIARERLPKELLVKKKQGFGVPLDKWLRHDGGEYLKAILLDPKTMNRGYFKKESIEKMISVFLNGKGDYYFPPVNGLVALLTLELWHRRYIDK